MPTLRPLVRFSPLPSAVLLLGLGLASCQKPASTDTAEAAGASETTPLSKPAVLVRVRPLHRGTVTEKLEATANVESLDVVEVMPERAEPVTALMVEEGDLVTQGQVLATLRDTDAQLAVDDATVKVEEARITMEQAKRELERDQALIAEQGPTGVLADRDLESRRQTYDVAGTAHQASLVALEQAKIGLAKCAIKAPIAGTVTLRDISLGDMVAVGTRVFQITDLAAPKVILYRPQRELPSLRIGQRLVAKSEALPGRDISGHIERIAPVVDQDTGTVKVTCALDPEAGMRVPTGILVRVTLTLETHDNALLMPKEALLYEGDRTSCFVVEEGKARKVSVELGFDGLEAVEITEDQGLTEGSLVVVVGADKLADGDAVEVAAE